MNGQLSIIKLVMEASLVVQGVLALLLAWGAQVLARRPPSGRFTYGFRSSTIWAALINAAVLLLAVGGIAWEALTRD